MIYQADEFKRVNDWTKWSRALRSSLQAAVDIRDSTANIIADLALLGLSPTPKQLSNYRMAKRVCEYRRIALENHTTAWLQWRMSAHDSLPDM